MQNIRIEDLVVIDIETASAFPNFEAMDSIWQELWEEKTNRILPEETTAAEFYPLRAGIMAEFSKIICISVGFYTKEDDLRMRVKSFYGHDEKSILQAFISTLQKIESINKNWCFAGHNIKEFDIPFICRRLLINAIPLPAFLDFQNKKPWETNLVDSFQYWRFGDYKQFTSLKLLAASLGIPSPKDDIDGSMVGHVYWVENDIKRIANYCQKDVITAGNIFLRFKNMPLLKPENIDIVD